MNYYGPPPYYYPPQQPQANPLQQINETISFYQGLKKQLKDEDKDKDDKKKKPAWDFWETFILVSLAMPFIQIIQYYFIWKLIH
jgi:hypothetical protein